MRMRARWQAVRKPGLLRQRRALRSPGERSDTRDVARRDPGCRFRLRSSSCGGQVAHPGYGTGVCRAPVNPLRQKYSTLPKFGNSVRVAHPGSSLRGDHVVVVFASRTCGGRGSVGRESLRAGRIALREPLGIARTNGADRLVSLWSWRQRARRRRTPRRTWRAARTAKPCGPGRRCYGQALAEAAIASTGAVPVNSVSVREARGKVRLPGEHGISRPTIAQGRPSDWHHLYAAVRFFCATFRAADRGCEVSTRPSLRPLGQEGGVTRQSSGEMRREGEKTCLRGRRMGRALAKPIMFWRSGCVMGFASLYPSYECILENWCCHTLRHCERSEAIQNPSAERLWIASLRPQ